MEFHRTPYLGSLIDVAVLPPYQEEPKPITVESVPLVGKSPESARSAGDEVSGRIITVTSSFPVVANVKPEVALRPRRGLSSLTAMIDYITNKSKWEILNISWIGEVEGMEEGENLTDEQKDRMTELLAPDQVPVWLDGAPQRWREYAEKQLWPVLHYSWSPSYNSFTESLGGSSRQWKDYVRMNEKYADVVISSYKEGDVILIHDMYLFLLPSILRKKLPGAVIGLYVPSPFPSSEIFRGLPQRNELLDGMLGATIIGFQSQQYIKHFISASTRLTGIEHSGAKLLFDGRYVACISLPFGINVQQVMERCETEEVQTLTKEIKALYSGKKIIVGRDKLDPTQGIVQKLRAFYALLELYPNWRGKVVFVQITTLTWQFSPALEQQMSHLISYINSRFGDLNYTPIVHFAKHMDQDEYFALLRGADVGFFVPTREGASSAAVEYVLCQNSRDDDRAIGTTMVLSEFMGITDLMVQGDTPVNPYDSLQVSFAMNQALMISSSGSRSEKDHEIVGTAKNHYDVGTFFDSFISQLVQHDLKHENQHYTPEANTAEMADAYKKAKRRLFLLDYDGTLTPIVRDPAAAVPTDRLKKILKDLTSDPNTSIWVISGRDMAFLDKHLSPFKVNLSAEHGCYVKRAADGPDEQWEDLVSNVDMSWMDVVMNVLQSYTERTEGSTIEKKNSAITWHYRRSDPEFGAFQASHLRAYLELTVARNYPIDVMAGKANVEIRPKLFNKGEIVSNILKEAKSKDEYPEFVTSIGDDTTDEDMFRVLSDQTIQKGLFTVRVGPENQLTLAKYHVNTVDKVCDLLEDLKP